MYSDHVYLVVDALLKRLVAKNALKLRLDAALVLQVSGHAALVLILTAASVRAVDVVVAVRRPTTTCGPTANGKTTNKRKKERKKHNVYQLRLSIIGGILGVFFLIIFFFPPSHVEKKRKYTNISSRECTPGKGGGETPTIKLFFFF